MYCCKCGARLLQESDYCHKCGEAVPTLHKPQVISHSGPKHAKDLNSEDTALIKELRSIDRRSDRCHACDCKEGLLSWEFGLGKPISNQWEWGETALSVAFSAITIPLLGVGALRIPGKSTRLRVLPLKLRLCKDCQAAKKGYKSHPWWNVLRQYGYTEFVLPQQMSK